MYKVLITGGIGVGKTTVCKLFEQLGVPVFYSDLQAKKITNSNQRVISEIKKHFGDHMYINNSLDRKTLGDIVFKDKNKLAILNSIVVDAVHERFDEWVDVYEVFKDSEYVINEAAIAIECNYQDKFDLTIVVTADEDIRIKRVMSRDACTEDSVRSRINSQLTEEEKIKHADIIIQNDDSLELEEQVKVVHEKILNNIKNI